ncbi:hypothetical protein ACIHQR_33555 [Corallococcus coralloides]
MLGLEFQSEGERLQLWTSATPLLSYKERVLQLEAELARLKKSQL